MTKEELSPEPNLEKLENLGKLERLDYFMKVSGDVPDFRKRVYICEIEYGNVEVFRRMDKAIDMAITHLKKVFKNKSDAFWDEYESDMRKWLHQDGETGAMGNDDYATCQIYRRDIIDD